MRKVKAVIYTQLKFNMMNWVVKTNITRSQVIRSFFFAVVDSLSTVGMLCVSALCPITSTTKTIYSILADPSMPFFFFWFNFNEMFHSFNWPFHSRHLRENFHEEQYTERGEVSFLID